MGTQYRSAIFYHDEEQKVTAENVLAELNEKGIWATPIVTQIEPFKVSYKAETYHKNYYKKHLNQPYCQQVITPKLVKLQQRFLGKFKAP